MPITFDRLEHGEQPWVTDHVRKEMNRSLIVHLVAAEVFINVIMPEATLARFYVEDDPHTYRSGNGNGNGNGIGIGIGVGIGSWEWDWE